MLSYLNTFNMEKWNNCKELQYFSRLLRYAQYFLKKEKETHVEESINETEHTPR